MPNVTAQVEKDDSLLSGRELSTLVCERIFDEPMPPAPEGCALFIDRVERSPKGAWLHVHIFEHGDKCEWIPRPFAEEIEAAMEVVEKMRSEGWHLIISDSDDRSVVTWFVDFLKKSDSHLWQGEAGADSLPEAICLAALATTEQN